MEQIELIAQKRAFPSRGRARIHGDDLSKLDLGEGAAVEISIPDMERWVAVTAYVDSLVDRGTIRLSEEDLKTIGADAGSKLRVRKKPPVTEQIRTTVQGAASSVSSGIGKAGEAIRGASPESISTGAKETAAGVSASLGKAGESISTGAKEAAAGVSASLGKAGESISTAFGQAVEAAKKKLKPADAVILDKALKANKGEVRAVTVPAGIGVRTLSSITLPKGVVLAAVQRGDAIQTTDSSFVLLSGDIVYFVGHSNLLDDAARVIGG
jgi:hypothetical protein